MKRKQYPVKAVLLRLDEDLWHHLRAHLQADGNQETLTHLAEGALRHELARRFERASSDHRDLAQRLASLHTSRPLEEVLRGPVREPSAEGQASQHHGRSSASGGARSRRKRTSSGRSKAQGPSLGPEPEPGANSGYDDHLGATPSEEQLLDAVAAHFDMPTFYFTDGTSRPWSARPRAVAIYMLHEHAHLTESKIAAMLHRSGPQAIRRYLDAVEEEGSYGDELRRAIHAIEQDLGLN